MEKSKKKRRTPDETNVPPSWEVARSFNDQQLHKSPLPIITENGSVAQQGKPKPKFVARARNKKRKATPVQNASPTTQNISHLPTENTSQTASKRARKISRRSLEKYAMQIHEFENVKARIASIASELISNPEDKVGLLKELREMGRQSKGKVSSLVLLSEAQLYKDIAPGYRIRQITEKEAETKVSKETKKLRDFEEALLSSYRRFVRSCVSLSNWRSSGESQTQASRDMTKVRLAACKALAELIASLPHFNEADLISNVVCAHASHREEEIRKISTGALSSVLRHAHKASGPTLGICVLIAKNLANVAAKKLRAAPAELVAPLTEIQFANFARLPLSKKSKNEPKKIKRLSKSKRQRFEKEKPKIDDKELEKDLQEADAEATPNEIYTAKKRLLGSVCNAYFNIIRAASSDVDSEVKKRGDFRRKKPPPALAPALKGLLRISSFINADIIDAILAALTPLLETGELPLTMRFRCLSAAYAILGVHARSQKAAPDSFTGDARALDAALYTALAALYSPEMPIREDETITFDAIEAIIAATTFRSIPSSRCAAFSRRLCILATIAPIHTCAIALLCAAQTLMPSSLVSPIFLAVNQDNQILFHDDGGFVQDFDMSTNDPEISGAERSASWELSCLAISFHPTIRDIAGQCASGKCGSKLPSAPKNILLTAKKHSSAHGGFNPLPQSGPTSNHKGHRTTISQAYNSLVSLLSEQESCAVLDCQESDSSAVEEFFSARWCERQATNSSKGEKGNRK